MTLVQLIILAVVQGLAELLPVSSSAHVIVAEKLLGLDPSSPQMTLVLVMLHTGTMFAVIAYFWNAWRNTYFESESQTRSFVVNAVWATFLTMLIGYPTIMLIQKMAWKGAPASQIEDLFGRLDIVGAALFAAGVIIIAAGLKEVRQRVSAAADVARNPELNLRQAGWIGAIQGLCLPFRGFSRSGATISTGLLAGASRIRTERFSFALAVILTPPVVGRELLRLLKASHVAAAAGHPIDLHSVLLRALLGAVFAFLAGLLALKWLSNWLENGRWYLFGIYCLVASAVVLYLHHLGY
ncbi:undecaprenyl-diphosphate phosphatase [Terriglobus albidus]|uniref:undecaprenyl-diphosphate phosphatase n=1 Tax=Terriglobus albidus TaxID=1592106 RepID=UPI0021E09BB2|nr:undecaprenyl-diphosphate phosphatase [Terriglobus albidus]